MKTSSFANVESFTDLINLTQAYIDSFSPNSKRIDGPTASNYTLWAQGFMARHVGLFGSCPTTNARLFGFNSDDLNGNIELFLKKLGPIAENIDPEEVKRLLLENISTNTGGFLEESLTFQEPEVNSVIENEIFSYNPKFQFIRTGVISSQIGGKGKGIPEKI